MRFLHGVEVHGAAIAHEVERIAIFGNAAGATEHLPGATEAAGVVQGKVMPELVSIDAELVVAVAPRGPRATDVGEARPAACVVVGHDIELVGVVGEVIARRRCRGVGEVADGRVVATRRCRGTGRQPVGHGDVEQLLAVGDFVVVVGGASRVRPHHLVDLGLGERVACRRVRELDQDHQHVVGDRRWKGIVRGRGERKYGDAVCLQRNTVGRECSFGNNRHADLQHIRHHRQL